MQYFIKSNIYVILYFLCKYQTSVQIEKKYLFPPLSNLRRVDWWLQS